MQVQGSPGNSSSDAYSNGCAPIQYLLQARLSAAALCRFKASFTPKSSAPATPYRSQANIKSQAFQQLSASVEAAHRDESCPPISETTSFGLMSRIASQRSMNYDNFVSFYFDRHLLRQYDGAGFSILRIAGS